MAAIASHPGMSDEDGELVRRARLGDRPAMELLFERYRAMVFAVGLSICGKAHDADEVVQDSFLRAFRRLDDWRGESKFSTWLYRIAMRVAMDWSSRFMRRPAREAPHRRESDPVRGDEMDRVVAAVQTLPLQQRLALTLRYFRAMSIAEIAEAQECSEGAVKANLHFALTKLRGILVRKTADE